MTIAPPIPRGTGINANIKLTKKRKIMIPIINSKIPIYTHLPSSLLSSGQALYSEALPLSQIEIHLV